MRALCQQMPLSQIPVESLTQQDLVIELRRVRDLLKSKSPDYSASYLKLRERECIAELARFTATIGSKPLSEVT
jgi:hypothetical protein